MEVTIILNQTEVLITTFLGPALACGYWLLKQWIKHRDKILRSKPK